MLTKVFIEKKHSAKQKSPEAESILRVYKNVGDLVEIGDLLFITADNEKVNEYASNMRGVIRKVYCQSGDRITPDMPVLEILGKCEGTCPPKVAPESGEASAPKPRVAPSQSNVNEEPIQKPLKEVKATSYAKMLANKIGLSLDEIKGTGPGDWITRSDVLITAIKLGLIDEDFDDGNLFADEDLQETLAPVKPAKPVFAKSAPCVAKTECVKPQPPKMVESEEIELIDDEVTPSEFFQKCIRQTITFAPKVETKVDEVIEKPIKPQRVKAKEDSTKCNVTKCETSQEEATPVCQAPKCDVVLECQIPQEEVISVCETPKGDVVLECKMPQEEVISVCEVPKCDVVLECQIPQEEVAPVCDVAKCKASQEEVAPVCEVTKCKVPQEEAAPVCDVAKCKASQEEVTPVCEVPQWDVVLECEVPQEEVAPKCEATLKYEEPKPVEPIKKPSPVCDLSKCNAAPKVEPKPAEVVKIKPNPVCDLSKCNVAPKVEPKPVEPIKKPSPVCDLSKCNAAPKIEPKPVEVVKEEKPAVEQEEINKDNSPLSVADLPVQESTFKVSSRIDVTKVVETCRKSNNRSNFPLSISLLSYFLKALAKTLKSFPIFNSTVQCDGQLVSNENIAIGLVSGANDYNKATGMLLDQADEMSVEDLAQKLKKLRADKNFRKCCAGKNPTFVMHDLMQFGSKNAVGLAPSRLAAFSIEDFYKISLKNGQGADRMIYFAPFTCFVDSRFIDSNVTCEFINTFKEIVEQLIATVQLGK